MNDTLSEITRISNEAIKFQYARIEPLLKNLSNDEIEKIPNVEDMPPFAKPAAERYGICDMLLNKFNGKYVYIYCIHGMIFKELKTPTVKDE